jgi:methyl-accepting chemotaxis protein
MNVKKGSEILENTDKRIMEIRDVSEENMEHTRKLNEQSHRQYETISEINESIRQFSDVIQSNAAMAQESSAAAQQMSAQATHLNEMLRIFKI